MTDLVRFLRKICEDYRLQPIALYRRDGDMAWPLSASSESELHEKLLASNKFEALPKESSTLGNIIEVSLTAYLLEKLSEIDDVEMTKGTERGYPDIEVYGPRFDGHHAVDIKVARRSTSLNLTQSRITLYTGNTYFRYPQLKWPSILRPFRDYRSHVDLIVLYTLDTDSLERVKDLELVIQESWRIASTERSSTTREYIGAINSIAKLRSGDGDFATPEEFYKFWRAYPFRIPKSVQKQLDKMLQQQDIDADQ